VGLLAHTHVHVSAHTHTPLPEGAGPTLLFGEFERPFASSRVSAAVTLPSASCQPVSKFMLPLARAQGAPDLPRLPRTHAGRAPRHLPELPFALPPP